jgi:hypothetical protein
MTYYKINPIIEFILFKIFCISISDEMQEEDISNIIN